MARFEDGELSLHRELLSRSTGNDTFASDADQPPQTPTLWKKSPDSIANFIENKRIDGIKERQENEDAAKDLNTMWDSNSTLTPCVDDNYCNFTNEFFALVPQPSMQIPVNPVLPQSIAVDGKRVYLGCLLNSAVYFFFDGYFRGISF